MTTPADSPSGGATTETAPAAPPAAALPAAVAPAVPASPPAQAAPPPAATPNPAPVQMTSDALKERLTEASTAATRAMLKGLGFESEEAAKSAIKKLSDLETANLSEKEKLEKRIKELEPLAARTSSVDGMLKSLVDTQFNELPESVRKAIDATANGDPDKRLNLIGIFRASGLLSQSPAAPAPAAPPTAPPPAAPASVTPSPAPAPSGTATKFQEWEAMRSRSPMLGDFFYQQHQREIERTRPAS